MVTCASSPPVPGDDGGRYLLQSALEHGPLHVPGRLVAGVLLLQPQPRALVLPQLGAQVLQQGLQRAAQLLVLHHLRGHGSGPSPHGRVLQTRGEKPGNQGVLGCFQGATGNGRRAMLATGPLGQRLLRAGWNKRKGRTQAGAGNLKRKRGRCRRCREPWRPGLPRRSG